jgi:hypothetical protein
MRRLIAILGIGMLAVTGCHFIAGKCDCGPMHGDPTTYAGPPALPTASPAPAPAPMPK